MAKHYAVGTGHDTDSKIAQKIDYRPVAWLSEHYKNTTDITGDIFM